MQLRRMLLTLFLAGLCCVSLAACTPDNTPSEPESSSSGDTLTTTLLPGGWDAADFTVLLLDKYGPMDGASPVTLTDEEQKELLNLLDISSWEPFDEADAPQHGLTSWLTLSAEDGRTLIVWDGAETGKTLFTLQETEEGERFRYAGPAEVSSQAQALRETVTARRDSLLPSGEAEILYPDLLPEALTSTGAYRTAAADPTAVINAAGRIATGRTAVDIFCKALENGGTGELTLYTFAPNYADPETIWCSYTRFWTDGGSSWYFSDYSEDSSFAFMEPSRYEVQALELSDYGYLAITDEVFSEPGGYPVIPDRLLWEDADQRIQLYDRYLEPVLISTALGSNEWDSLMEIPQPLWVFEDLYRYDHQNTSPFDVYGTDWPADEMTALLSRYFDGVTEEQLIDKYQDIYDPASGTLHYEGGRGGGPYYLRVTGWEEDGDRLTLHYEEYSPATGEPYEAAPVCSPCGCLRTAPSAILEITRHKFPIPGEIKNRQTLRGLSVFLRKSGDQHRFSRTGTQISLYACPGTAASMRVKEKLSESASS